MKCKKCDKEVVCSELCRGHFVDYLEKKVRKTIRQYKLFNKNDKIAVAVSGGKDSTVVLYMLHKMGYPVTGITVDALIGNYTKKNLENLKEVCNKHDINLKELNFREEFGHSLCYIQSIVKQKGLQSSFVTVYGAPNKKTDMVRKIITESDINPSEALYVGDAISDYDAAKNNGVNFIARARRGEMPFANIKCLKVEDLTDLDSAIRKL